MDSALYQGAMLIALMIAFLGLWGWAWSRKRKRDFDEASRLPLEEDDGTIPSDDKNGN